MKDDAAAAAVDDVAVVDVAVVDALAGSAISLLKH